jgi:hypothetical protein
MSSANTITVADIYAKLSQKVSTYNARLMLRSAMVTSGVEGEDGLVLENEQVKAICLALINKGGPSFQVGKDIYRTLQ